MTLRYMEHVVQPMRQVDRDTDLRSWRALGTGTLVAPPKPHDPRRCSAVNKYGHPCELWGSFVVDGKRWCQHHKPDGAERR
jgi:hypothetical protein